MLADRRPVHPVVRWVTAIALVAIVALAGWQFVREIGRMRSDPAPSVEPSSALLS